MVLHPVDALHEQWHAERLVACLANHVVYHSTLAKLEHFVDVLDRQKVHRVIIMQLRKVNFLEEPLKNFQELDISSASKVLLRGLLAHF